MCVLLCVHFPFVRVFLCACWGVCFVFQQHHHLVSWGRTVQWLGCLTPSHSGFDPPVSSASPVNVISNLNDRIGSSSIWPKNTPLSTGWGNQRKITYVKFCLPKQNGWHACYSQLAIKYFRSLFCCKGLGIGHRWARRPLISDPAVQLCHSRASARGGDVPCFQFP